MPSLIRSFEKRYNTIGFDPTTLEQPYPKCVTSTLIDYAIEEYFLKLSLTQNI